MLSIMLSVSDESYLHYLPLAIINNDREGEEEALRNLIRSIRHNNHASDVFVVTPPLSHVLCCSNCCGNAPQVLCWVICQLTYSLQTIQIKLQVLKIFILTREKGYGKIMVK